MPTEVEVIDSNTTTKQNFAGTDNEDNDQVLVFREKLRQWNKIFRIRKQGDSEDRAVIIPFDTFFEPYFNEEDMDSAATSAFYNTTEHYYELYADLLNNYNIIESKIFSFRQDHKIKSVTMTVQAEFVDGSDGISGVDLEIYNGNEWIAVKNATRILFDDYLGQDLDADLDTFLYASYSNYDYDTSTFLFQNKLQYRITRNTLTKVIIKKTVINIDWEF